ncbi:Oxidoreductase [Tilletia horrida]|nr:Oxidoreductase [Tilletia horrida]KAK0564093.1 Oxidoreductase [Tilletia horrida]
MLTASASLTSRLARSACTGSLAAARRTGAAPAARRWMSSGSGSAAASSSSSSSSSTAAAVAVGLIGGTALFLGMSGSSHRLELEGRPGFAERLKARTKAVPASRSEASEAPKQQDKAAHDHVEASEGTGAFASSLSATEAAPEAAEIVVEGSEPSSNQAAYNPDTGEINWDCPCLGGMAQGSCGEEFKAAFSCFVYSEKEPKGIECVDRFKAMQECFRKHPEEYAEEIADDERAAAEEEAEKSEAAASSASSASADEGKPDESGSDEASKPKSKPKSKSK